MRVLFYLESDQKGGIDTFVINLINNISTNNLQICLICNSSHPGTIDLASQLNDDVDFVSFNIPTSWYLSNRYLPFIKFKYRRYVHPFLRLILFNIQKYKLRKVFKNQLADQLFVVNGGFPGGETSRLANIVWYELYGKKSIHNFHNDCIKPHFLFKWFDSFVDQKLAKSVSNFITVSNSCARTVENRPQLRNVDVKVVYNSVPQINLNSHARPIGNKCLFLANYEPRKGHEFLFNVMEIVRSSIPDVSLEIFGSRTREEYIYVNSLRKKIAPQLNVELNDFSLSIKDYLNDYKILLICSQEFESFGLTSIEAMSVGVPVVSTNVGGLKEVIIDGVGGFLFERDDEIGFASKVIDLLTNSNYRNEIGALGIEYVSNNFSVKRMVDNYKLFIYGE